MTTQKHPTNAVTADASISKWGNGLGVRLTAPLAKASGMVHGARVRIHALPGVLHVVAESSERVALAFMRAELESHLKCSPAELEDMALARMHREVFSERVANVDAATELKNESR